MAKGVFGDKYDVLGYINKPGILRSPSAART